MELPINGITTTKVANALGSASRNVGALCTNSNINIWSKYKPIRFSKPTPISDAEFKTKKYGLNVSNYGIVDYDAPTGTAMYPFRIGDFRRYNHTAKPPVSVVIVSVNNNTVPPYVVTKNYSNTIDFMLVAGDILPQDLRDNCYREKNTEIGGGYGGISWIAETTESTSTLVDRIPEDVFGTFNIGQVYSQSVVCNNLPRLEYMRYKGDAWNKYESTGNWIEDRSYLEKFVLFDYTEDVNFSGIISLLYNTITGKVDAMLRVRNNSGSTVNGVRVRARYTINAPDMPIVGESGNQFVEGDAFNLVTGNNNTMLSLNTFRIGEINRYTSYFFLEKFIGNSWVQISSAQVTNVDVFVPMPD